MSILGLRLAGWKFEYQPETKFVQASHPSGGKFSVVRVEVMHRHGFNPDDFGEAIVDMLSARPAEAEGE